MYSVIVPSPGSLPPSASRRPCNVILHVERVVEFGINRISACPTVPALPLGPNSGSIVSYANPLIDNVARIGA